MPPMPSASYVPLATQRAVLVARSALDGPSEQLLRWSERYGLPGVGEIDVSLEGYFMAPRHRGREQLAHGSALAAAAKELQSIRAR